MTGKDKEVDVDELLQMLVDDLATWSGVGIADVANNVMGDDVEITYIGDSLFDVKFRK